MKASSKLLIVCALLGWLVFAAAHLLGGREYTTIISGSTPGTSPLRDFDVVLMIVYICSYFFAIVVSPILLIAVTLQSLLRRMLGAYYL